MANGAAGRRRQGAGQVRRAVACASCSGGGGGGVARCVGAGHGAASRGVREARQWRRGTKQGARQWRSGERVSGRASNGGGGVVRQRWRQDDGQREGERAPGERPRPCVHVWAGETGRGGAAMGVFRGAGARRGCGERGQRAYEAVVRGVRRRGEHIRGPVGESARRRRGRGGGKAEADGLTGVAGAQGGEGW
nr:spidroin-1-like [Aegilops tauschii subsp. strangulata]